MEFRDLKAQYNELKGEIDEAISDVLTEGNFIMGHQVTELERELADYAGVKHCITCANGTDALEMALMAWGIKEGDAVFVPDFTFFSSGEVVPLVGATPVFVDVYEDTFNINVENLEKEIERVIFEGVLRPRVIVAVDLFGQPADHKKIREIAEKYQLLVLEDGAQGFGGSIEGKKACGFGDIGTTSFFPAKPLGCYGDGGAVFTNDDEWAGTLRSIRIHGKGTGKYDNVRIGRNSRLDTIQAAILLVKLKNFKKVELDRVNRVAEFYSKELQEYVKVPYIKPGFYSSWAQYTIKLSNRRERDSLKNYLKDKGIPSMVYYPKPMHLQEAFSGIVTKKTGEGVLCDLVLSLPIHPYLKEEEMWYVVNSIKDFLNGYL